MAALLGLLQWALALALLAGAVFVFFERLALALLNAALRGRGGSATAQVLSLSRCKGVAIELARVRGGAAPRGAGSCRPAVPALLLRPVSRALRLPPPPPARRRRRRPRPARALSRTVSLSAHSRRRGAAEVAAAAAWLRGCTARAAAAPAPGTLARRDPWRG